jgi:hypothetical protein
MNKDTSSGQIRNFLRQVPPALLPETLVATWRYNPEVHN